MWQTHHAHKHAHTHSRTCPPTAFTVQVVAVRWVGVRQTMTKLTPPFRLFLWPWMACRCFIQINSRVCDAVFEFGCFSWIKTLLGRTEMRTYDRMCFQTIRTVWDTSRDDRARIATCSLLTSTDRFKENYSIDVKVKQISQYYMTICRLHTEFGILNMPAYTFIC